MPSCSKVLAQERDRVLAQGQASMAVVLDDIVPICHLPEFDVGLLLLGDCLHSRARPQQQRAVVARRAEALIAHSASRR